MIARSRSVPYRPELDILRFLAFLWVFAVHAVVVPREALLGRGVPASAVDLAEAVVRAGSYGVDLFFVLSAYLITELLRVEKAATGALDVRAFYVRRVLRIWPLYYVFLALAAGLPPLNPGGEFDAVQVGCFALFLGNWSFYFLGWVGYVAIPLWSLSVEEQFYLLWPPLVKRLSGRSMIALACGLIGLANAVRWAALARHEGTRHLWTNTFAHLDSIAAGILLALLLGGRAPRFGTASRLALAAAGVCAIVLRGHSVGIEPADRLEFWQTVLQYPLVVAACTAILVAFLGAPWRSRALEYLGRISYGLYVLHMTSIYLVDRVLTGAAGPLHAIERLALSLALTVAAASLSYVVLERPFLRLKARFSVVESRAPREQYVAGSV